MKESPDKDDKNLWLFNIHEDPLEQVDLSSTKQGIVKFMLDRLVYWNSTAVPVNYPDKDPNSNAALHGNAWVPWM